MAVRAALKRLAPGLARNSVLRRVIALAFFARRPGHHLNRRHPYDRQMGIRASGFLPTYLLFTGRPEDEHNNSYIGCVPDTLRRVLSVLPGFALPLAELFGELDRQGA